MLKRTLFLFAILLLLSFIFYKETIGLMPSYQHAWTMSDRYALAIGFLNNGFDLFHPQLFNLQTKNGITAVDFPIHEWIIAVIMKITGSTAPIIFRSYLLVWAILGHIFLFFLIYHFTQSFNKSAITAIFAFTCPVITYYQASFIPSIPSFACVWVGFYYLFNYRRSQEYRYLSIGAFFLTLAALTRLPFIMALVSWCLISFLEQFKTKKIRFF